MAKWENARNSKFFGDRGLPATNIFRSMVVVQGDSRTSSLAIRIGYSETFKGECIMSMIEQNLRRFLAIVPEEVEETFSEVDDSGNEYRVIKMKGSRKAFIEQHEEFDNASISQIQNLLKTRGYKVKFDRAGRTRKEIDTSPLDALFGDTEEEGVTRRRRRK